MTYKMRGDNVPACPEGCCVLAYDADLRPILRNDGFGVWVRPPTVSTIRPMYSVHRDVGGDGYTHLPHDYDRLDNELDDETPIYL